MPKQLNVNLAFTADTKQAQQQIAQLQKSLNDLMSSSVKDNAFTGFNKEISNAQQSVLKLKTAINNSLNADTGRLDLSKFNQQLNNSGLSLGKLASDMNAMGSDGQKAFLNLANSIVTAQKPVAETNKLLDGMWTALKNTARWQISSSMLHGFMGAISGAYGYAQDLNQSLNNIRIVTGQSTDQMAAFAEQANKSAQALSTSTLAYTDAALIYYQQGLNDEEVQARTETTLKMSNVTRDSVEEVSSYMTAIWNNFAEGADNLELFADKITALGAATASSSAEIAQGLNQFAALGSSLGLNYDDAVAALATVVAQTRQSASTVGNSFRTLFQRIESLKLGDTLEDGVGLTKYSLALEKVGVQVLDVNGEMRDMHDVIQDLGAVWQNLSKAQQNALAQTVGGVRNSNTLIAWMDNFEKFQENLNVSYNAEGALEKQAEIYAESWEAAKKRVQAAWQAIYQDLINDKFFISISNGIGKILESVDSLIDSIGGLPGVLSGIGVIITSLFGNKIVSQIEKAQQQLKVFTGVAAAEQEALIEVAKYRMDEMFGGEQKSSVEAEVVRGLKDEIDLNYKLKNVYDELNSIQKEFATGLIDITKGYHSAYVEALKLKEATEKDTISKKRDISNTLTDYGRESSGKKGFATKIGKNLGIGEVWKDIDNKTGETQYIGTFGENIQKLIDNSKNLEDYEEMLQQITGEYSKMAKATGLSTKQIREYLDAVVQQEIATKKVENAFKSYQGKLKETDDVLNEIKQIQKDHNLSTEETIQIIDKLIAAKENEIKSYEESEDSIDKESEEYKNLAASIEHLQQVRAKVQKGTTGIFSEGFGESIVLGAKSISQLSMGINTLISSWDTLNNKDTTFLQKFSATAMALSMGVPALRSGIINLGKAFATMGIAANGASAASMGLLTALGALWPYIAVVGVLAGAWYALDKIIYTTEERLADSNKRLEEANEALGKAEEAAQKTSDAYQKLVDTLDGFDSKEDAINQLTEGTIEWKEAIADSNAELLAALEASDQLSKAKLSYGKGGLIRVENASELKADARSNSLTSDIGVALSKINVLNEETNNALTGALHEIKNLNDHEAYQKGDITFDQLIDYNKNIGRQTDEELLNTIKDWAQQVVDNGYAGQDLKKLIDNGDTQLSFLEDIKDREDILQAIQQAADKIAGADKESDAYKKEVGRIAADAAGYDTSNMSGSALENFYLQLYENLQSQVQDKWNGLGEEEQLKYFAEGSGGQYKYDEETNQLIDTATRKVVESSEIAQSEIRNLGQAAMIEQEAVSQSNIDLLQQEHHAIQQQRFDLQSKLENNFDEVNAANSGAYTAGLSSEQMSFALDVDASQFKTVTDFLEYVKKACEEQHHIDFEINAEDLSNFKGKTEDLEVEVNKLSEFIQKNADKFEGLSEHLKDCKEAADMVAYSFIRFDDALQDIANSADDWKKAFKSGDIIEINKAVQELKKTYGNLLDLDGSQLSDDFLQTEKNVDLLTKVLNGTEEEAIAAYAELQKLAALDIAKNNAIELGIDFNEDSFNEAYDTVASLIDDMHLVAGEDIEVGDADYGKLASSLNAMLAMVGDDAAAAQALMKAMGFTATLTNEPVVADDTSENQDIETEWTDNTAEAVGYISTAEGDGVNILPGEPVKVNAPRLKTYPGAKSLAENKKTVNVQSYHIDPDDPTIHFSGGGAPKIKNAPARRVGNSGKGKGGGCFASGTLITTDHSYKNIEDIKVGDIVLSYNEKTKKNEYSKVLQTMIHNVYEKIYDLFVKDDKLKVTGNHRFLVVHNNEQKWIEAADLQVGDLVLFANGTLHQISKIKTQTRFITVYNFEVSNTHNYYVGENQILAHNKGGNKGSQRKPKEPVKYEKKEDRYHDLKEQLEDVRLQYDKVNKAKERAFGKSKLKYLDLEIKQLEQEDKLLKDYIKEAEKYYQIDRSKVEDLNIDAKFDENGALINYEEVLSRIEDDMVKATDEYNKAILAWNAGGSDEDFEDAEKAKKNAEELQKTRMEALKKLEDTYNTWQNKVWEEIQKRWEIYDAKLEKVTLNVEIELEFNEDDLKLLEFIFDHMGDSADTAVDKIANLNEQMKEYDDNIKHIRSGLQGIFANHGIEIDLNNMNPDEIAKQLVSAMDDDTFASELTDEEAKTIRDYISQLMDNTKKLEESFDQVFETVKEGYDQWNERLQDQISEYARLNKIVSSYKDLVSLTGKDAFGLSYDELNKWNQELVHVAQNQAESAEKIWKDNEALYQNAVAMYNTAETEEEKKKWKEIMDQRKKTTDEAHQDYLDKVNEWQQAIQTAFEEALDYAKDKYEKSFGQFNFNFIEDEYERLSDLDKLYLKPYEKYHDLQKSLKELSKSITDTTNPTVLNKMLTLQDEINDKMASGVQMSSYETGIIERRVALLQAEADLQNAKNAKGAVRMTRDNEGNFSYTYTADQNAIDEAQANLSDKFYELLKFERDSLDEIQSRILEETRTYQETLDELARTYGEDSAEYMYYAKIVTDDHIQKMQFLESQSGILYGEMGRLRDDDWKDYERILGLKLADTENFLTTEKQTLLGSLFGEQGIFPTIRASEQQYLQDIQDDITQYGANTQAVVDNVTTNMKEDIKSIGTTTDETKIKVHDLGEEMKKAMTDADTAAKGIAQTWAEHMKKVRDDTTSTTGNLNELLKKLNSITTVQKSIADGYERIKNSANAATVAMQNVANSGGGGGSGDGGGGTSGGGSGSGNNNGGTNKTGTQATAPIYSVYYLKWPSGYKEYVGQFTSDSAAALKGKAMFNNRSDYGTYYLYKGNSSTGYSWTHVRPIGGALGSKTNVSMDSGGYTGDWGDSSGKLAILHRKEIVLNKEDTSNFLDAVGIVRSIKDFIDMGARNLGNVFNYNVMAGVGTTDLQQQVHIEASFPNVQSHNEIELAFNNLINSATQYVNRKR